MFITFSFRVETVLTVPPQHCDPRPLGSCPEWLDRETRFNEKKMLHERVPKELIPSNIPRGVNGGLKKRGGVREELGVIDH